LQKYSPCGDDIGMNNCWNGEKLQDQTMECESDSSAECVETELFAHVCSNGNPDHGRIQHWLRRLIPGAQAQNSIGSLLRKEDSADASTVYSSSVSFFVETEPIRNELEENVEVSTGWGSRLKPDESQAETKSSCLQVRIIPAKASAKAMTPS
jgi:hypothetical protein